MRLIVLFIIFSLNLFSARLREGTYRGVLKLDTSAKIELPFIFEVKHQGKRPTIIIINGEEKIVADEIRFLGDSVFIQMPVFDTEFRCKVSKKGMEGFWYNHYRKENNIIPFTAVYGENQRFPFVAGKANPVFEGKWRVQFSPRSADSSNAIGIFHHIEQTDYITGTFLTETGDFRFLEGMRKENEMYLSCFDGSHAFLFIAKLRPGEQILDGKFYSGAHSRENWLAVLDMDFELRSAEAITFVKNREEKVDLSFPDLEKKIISLHDTKFQNKPIILQVMGSWCPNCMDESAYFAQLYKQYQPHGLEIVALAFEKTGDFEKAKTQVSRLIKKYDITYTVLLTLQTGKEKASESLKFINSISAFPTTIFLNKEHKVVKIHTGFSGPATGNEYLRWTKNTEELIKELLKE